MGDDLTKKRIDPRFIEGTTPGAARALSEHDPYAIVDRANPNGRAMVEAVICWNGNLDARPGATRPFVIPKGSRLISFDGTPLFETQEDADFGVQSGDRIVGALAVKPGSAYNVPPHHVRMVEGYAYGHVVADNPYPAQGGADLIDGQLVMTPRDPVTEQDERLANALDLQKGEFEGEALRHIKFLVLDGLHTKLPEPWDRLVTDLITEDGFDGTGVSISNLLRGQGQLGIALAHDDATDIGLVFAGSRLVEVRFDGSTHHALLAGSAKLLEG